MSYQGFPKQSPWGEVQDAEKIAEGVYRVHTAGHGGLMVHKTVRLSDDAYRIAGEEHGQFWCFEEDCAVAVAMHELKLGNQVSVRATIERWYPEYLAYIKSK